MKILATLFDYKPKRHNGKKYETTKQIIKRQGGLKQSK